mmetsp:Transcript_24137/g.59523  ORF Transcript_24137/g.59523 Transcript_24137/m.59523 type:complete len:190 (+) Transcript_24137:66-635(+)
MATEADGQPGPPAGRGGNKVAPETAEGAAEDSQTRPAHVARPRKNSFDSSRQSSSSSLYERRNQMLAVEYDTPPDKHPMLTTAFKNKEVLGSIFILLVITFICAYFEALRLPTCAVQTLLIGFASLRWEEDSWIATSPSRALRIIAQVFLTLVPFAIGVLLVILCVQESRATDEVAWDSRADIGPLLDL